MRPGDGTVQARAGRGALVRWLLSYGTFSVPQAAGPIAFALLALPLTGRASSGAAIVLVITVAQVVGAVPVAGLGRHRNAVSFLKLLVGIRAVALVGVAVLAASGAPFASLLAAAALGGLVNGAAFGFLRSVLNDLVGPAGLPRALGLASTLSEFTFVAAPVAASFLGTVNPVGALLALVALGTAPMILVPRLPGAKPPAPVDGGGRLLSPAILLWLGCTFANSAVVSSIEIGAVSLALRYGFAPAQGYVFTVALCAASVAGGLWVSARNVPPSRPAVLGCLAVMSAGAGLITAGVSVGLTAAGAVAVGCVLAPLGTSYSLRLDALSPPHRKAELFALSRTANSLGIILTSASLAFTSLPTTQLVAAALVVAATVAVWIGRH